MAERLLAERFRILSTKSQVECGVPESHVSSLGWSNASFELAGNMNPLHLLHVDDNASFVSVNRYRKKSDSFNKASSCCSGCESNILRICEGGRPSTYVFNKEIS
jgi:hypothetical protein